MKVKVLKLGYAAREVVSEQSMTVDEAIRSSGMEVGGYKITLNGVGADLAAPVHSAYGEFDSHPCHYCKKAFVKKTYRAFSSAHFAFHIRA